jgi:hypothetical protein
MKQLFLFAVALCITATGFSQWRNIALQKKNSQAAERPSFRHDGNMVGVQQTLPIGTTKTTLTDDNIGWSFYDLQSNNSTQQRIYRHPDGTMGGILTMSHEATTTFNDRGTGYNYYNGTAWGTPPNTRLESNRAGWPNYAPFGPNGEIIVSHRNATNPLYVLKRNTKGTGTWTEIILNGPTGASGLDWPRMVTNGPDNTCIHIIAVTGPTSLGGIIWQGLDGAIVYNRSLDGGTTWQGWELLDGMTSSQYLGFDGDTYGFAPPKGDTLCFVVSGNWNDQFLMKSTDNGATWTKIMIWSCPWNLWTGPDTTGIFYCPDGATNMILDKDGKAHMVFGLQRARGDETGGKFWYPFTDGLIYWNEDMGELPQDLDPDTLWEHGNYIGWVQDTMVFYAAIEELAYYYMSLSSMPTIVYDENENIFVVWSGVTTLRDPNGYMLRHLFARASTDNGVTWRDTIVDLTNDFIYTWSECAYPSASPTSTEKLFILFMEDTEGGTYVKGLDGAQGQVTATTNNFLVLTPDKDDIIVPGVGIEEPGEAAFRVSGLSPNPARDKSSILVYLNRPGNLSMGMYSVIGQKVLDIQKGNVTAGSQQFVIDASCLDPGIYFCTVKVDSQRVTKKLVIE